MVHSFTKIYIHLVWSTKERQPLLHRDARPAIRHHVLEYASSKRIFIRCLNLQIDHVHASLSLLSNQCVDDLVRLLKGESSHWINHQNVIGPKFSWQRGYGAFSISPGHLNAVESYIRNQDEHHRKKSFGQEFTTLLGKYGYAGTETDEPVSP